MKKELKRQIKEDEFATGVERAWKWIKANEERVQIAGIALLVIVGGATAFTWFRSSRNQAAQKAFGEALTDFNAKVATELAPGSTETAAFPTAKDKYAKALAGFQGVSDRHGSSDVGRRARFYAALCRIELGEQDAARTALTEVAGQSRDALLAAQARFALAGLHTRAGDLEKALAEYKQMADDPALAVPRDFALMRLAGALEDARRGSEAERAYTRVYEEFPQSLFADEARRRAAYLKDAGQS